MARFNHLHGPINSFTLSRKASDSIKHIDENPFDDTYNEEEIEIFQYIIIENIVSRTNEEQQDILRNFGINYLVNRDNIISLLQKATNRSKNATVRIIANLLEIKIEHMFNVFPITQNTSTFLEDKELVERKSLPATVNTSRKTYELNYVHWENNFSQKKEQAICFYTASYEDNFFLVATITQDEYGRKIISIGESAGIAYCFERCAIADSSSDIPVVFPLDPLIAMCLKKCESQTPNPLQQYILSGCFVGKSGFEALHLEDLRSKTIILIPEFSDDGLLKCIEFADKLKKYNCTVRVFTGPIFLSAMKHEEAKNCTISPWKAQMAQSGTNLFQVEILSNFVHRIINDSVTEDDFRKYLLDINLLSYEKQELQKIDNIFPLWSFADIQTDINIDATNLALLIIFSPGSITLIWGSSHSGKSTCALTCACGLASGKGVFCFTANSTPIKVLYIDGESTKHLAKERLDRVTANNYNQELLDKNLIYMGCRGQGISFTDPNFQKNLLQFIKDNKIKVVFFDNLISLFDSASFGSKVDLLFAFFYELEKLGVAVCFIHHANKEGNMFKGSADLESKSQTVFYIEGNEQINYQAEQDDNIENGLAQPSLLRITCKKCKDPQELTGQHGMYQLSPAEGWTYLNGSEYFNNIHLKPESQHHGFITNQEISGITSFINEFFDESIKSLDEKKIGNSIITNARKILSFFDDKTQLSRKNLEEKIGLGESSVGAAIKFLKDMNILIKIVNGNKINYQLSNNIISIYCDMNNEFFELSK